MSIPTTGEIKLQRQVKKDLDRHEGYREFAYPDPLSPLFKKYPHLRKKWGYKPARELLPADTEWSLGAPWTVGHGFTGEGITQDSKMDRTLSERKLEEKILQINTALNRALSWYTDTSFVTKTILINMTFNMGLVGVLKFKNTLAYIKAQNYSQAAANMEKSLWYSQVGVRAQELVKRMRTQTIEPQHAAQEKI